MASILLLVVFIASFVAFYYIKGIKPVVTQNDEINKEKEISPMTAEECELEANKKYSEKIKLFGTPVPTNGKKEYILSFEQWESINNDRLEEIENCQEPSSANI